MNSQIKTLLAIAATSAGLTFPSFAAPIDFGEVSLLVRAGESQPAIAREVSRRKLTHPLTTQEETKLKAQGASDSLVQQLRQPENALPSAEAAAYDAQREQRREAARTNANDENASTRGPQVHVFNVAFGHPINLSQWGGYDYEIAFQSFRYAGETQIIPVMLDPYRSITEISRPVRFTSEDEAFASDYFLTNSVRNKRFTPYSAQGDFRDPRLQNSDTVSVSSTSASRPLPIDWQNPTFIKGQPYAFYPVYGAGQVALYYIGQANDRTARVAIVTRR